MTGSVYLTTAQATVMKHALRLLTLGLTVCAAACHGSAATSTTAASTVTTVAAPTTTEDFAGTVPVGGAKFYSFTVTTNGTVNLTLNTVGGTGVPSTVMLGLGIGTPSGKVCATATTINTASGTTPQVTGTYAPGLYCANVADVGNLEAPATFDVSIAHP
jgi:hypothetical protein